MKKIIIICTLLVLSSGCTTYFSPDRYANPRHKFESGNKRYERKMRRMQKECAPTIDPLRMRH